MWPYDVAPAEGVPVSFDGNRVGTVISVRRDADGHHAVQVEFDPPPSVLADPSFTDHSFSIGT